MYVCVYAARVAQGISPSLKSGGCVCMYVCMYAWACTWMHAYIYLYVSADSDPELTSCTWMHAYIYHMWVLRSGTDVFICKYSDPERTQIRNWLLLMYAWNEPMYSPLMLTMAILKASWYTHVHIYATQLSYSCTICNPAVVFLHYMQHSCRVLALYATQLSYSCTYSRCRQGHMLNRDLCQYSVGRVPLYPNTSSVIVCVGL